MLALTCKDKKSPINQQSNIFPSLQCHWPVSLGWVFIGCCFKHPGEKKLLLKPHLTHPSCRKKTPRRQEELCYGTLGKLQPVPAAPGWALWGMNTPSLNPGAPPAPRLIKACGRLQGGKPAAGAWRRLHRLQG